jgi:hypothetical protein
MSYFYVFDNNCRVVLTFENCDKYETFTILSFGQAARFIEELEMPIRTKLQCLLTVLRLDSAEEQVRYLAQEAAYCEGYNREVIDQVFEGSWVEFAAHELTKAFDFNRGQKLTSDQEAFVKHINFAELQDEKRSRLGRLIRSELRFANRNWVIPACYDF